MRMLGRQEASRLGCTAGQNYNKIKRKQCWSKPWVIFGRDSSGFSTPAQVQPLIVAQNQPNKRISESSQHSSNKNGCNLVLNIIIIQHIKSLQNYLSCNLCLLKILAMNPCVSERFIQIKYTIFQMEWWQSFKQWFVSPYAESAWQIVEYVQSYIISMPVHEPQWAWAPHNVHYTY